MNNASDEQKVKAYLISEGYLTPEDSENEKAIFDALILWQADKEEKEREKEQEEETQFIIDNYPIT